MAMIGFPSFGVSLAIDRYWLVWSRNSDGFDGFVG